MKLAAALRDARASSAVVRAQRRIVVRYREAAQLPQPAFWRLVVWQFAGLRAVPALLPLLVPLFAWQAGGEGGPGSVLAGVLVLVVGGHLFQSRALEFSADEVLRHPSKAGVLLLRMARWTPILLWPGVCWALAWAIHLGPALARQPAAVAVLVAIVATPLVWALGKLAGRLAASETSTLYRAAIVVAAVAYILQTTMGSLTVAEIVLGALLTMAATGSLILLSIAWMKQPRRQLRGLVLEVSALPRIAVGLGLVLPAPDLDQLGWLAWAVPAVLLLLCAQALRQALATVGEAEENTAGSVIARAEPAESRAEERTTLPRRLPVWHRGAASLMRAQWFLHRGRWLRWEAIESLADAFATLPRLAILCFYHAWGPLLAALAALRTESALAAPLAIISGATAPAFVRIGLHPDLWRMGVDYRQQVRHDLRAIGWFAALPTLLAGITAGALAGWEDNQALIVAVIAAVLALRAGWRGLARRELTGRHEPRLVLAVIVIVVASAWLPLVSWWTVSAALALGLAGVWLRHRRREGDLACEVAALEP